MKGLLAKILAAQILSVLLALLVMVIAARVSLQQGFIDFLERQEAVVLADLGPALAHIYETQGGWDFLIDRPNHWQRILRHNPAMQQEGGPPGPPPGGRRSRPFAGGPPSPLAVEQQLRWLRTLDRLKLRDRLFLLDGERAWVAGARDVGPEGRTLAPVEAEGAIVGWIGFAPMDRFRPPEVDRYLGGQLRTLTLSLLLALGLAAGLGLLLARHLSRPVRELEDTVRALTHGRSGGWHQSPGGNARKEPLLKAALDGGDRPRAAYAGRDPEGRDRSTHRRRARSRRTGHGLPARGNRAAFGPGRRSADPGAGGRRGPEPAP
jgi:two-component system sensor histidine kinase BaeS